jgi:hypothetical protein
MAHFLKTKNVLITPKQTLVEHINRIGNKATEKTRRLLTKGIPEYTVRVV